MTVKIATALLVLYFLLLLPGCATKVLPVAVASELLEVPPEPIVPDPAVATEADFAEYTTRLWFAYKDMADKINRIRDMQE